MITKIIEIEPLDFVPIICPICNNNGAMPTKEPEQDCSYWICDSCGQEFKYVYKDKIK